ncbi:uncharacterized protein METZ01_LOCUS247605, partial [marine metagenome]
REALMATDAIPGDLDRLFPICTPGASDSAGFDEALELLTMGGYSLPEAILMMIPEPWENHGEMSDQRRAFYQYHASLMEPWDGPASIAFTDGTVMGAVLDRNGLRPSRYWVTADDLVVMASEVGVVEVPTSEVVEKGRLQPGRMFLIDTAEGRIIRDDEIKDGMASGRPYRKWLDQNLVHLDDLPLYDCPTIGESALLEHQQVYGYTHEALKVLLAPMARDGKGAIGSMGTDTPVAVLSNQPRPLYDYFQQLFAQVTNPPLDAMREELITALGTTVGAEGNLLAPGPESCHQIHLPHPVLTEGQMASIIGLGDDSVTAGPSRFSVRVLDGRYEVARGARGLTEALDRLRSEASDSIDDGITMLVLSDRSPTAAMAPIPSLLATGAVHHHLIREKTRARVGLLVESGDAREVHHVGLLLGYGASAVCPYLAFASVDAMVAEGMYGLSPDLTAE